MSTAVTLKKSMARSVDAVSSLTQYAMMVAGLLFFLGIAGNFFDDPRPREETGPIVVSRPDLLPVPDTVVPVSSGSRDLSGRQPVPGASENDPRLLGVLDYVKRRYRVSPDVVMPIVEVAELIGKERRIDPLLILAIIGVESGFNPFAESPVGARGLMQVVPRFHLDKIPDGLGSRHFFDPVVNIRVGVNVLEEAIKRRGGLVPGLQQYAGSSDVDGSYASKVLAEKARMEKAARRRGTGTESDA